jgi:hypothetical protein
VVTDVSPELSKGRLWRSLGWRSAVGYDGSPSTATVTYTHGWPEGHQRLQLARSVALSLAAAAYTNPTGAVREQIDDYAVAYEKASATLAGMPTLVAELRRQYGRPARSVRLLAGRY